MVTFQNRSWLQHSSYLSRKSLQDLQFSTSAQVLYFEMVLKTERMGNSLTIKSSSMRTFGKARPSLQHLSWTRQLLFARTRKISSQYSPQGATVIENCNYPAKGKLWKSPSFMSCSLGCPNTADCATLKRRVQWTGAHVRSHIHGHSRDQWIYIDSG